MNPTTTDAALGAVEPTEVTRARWVQRLLKQRATLVWATLLLLIVILAIAAPWIAPYDPNTGSLFDGHQDPNGTHWLGTDGLGRDTLSRLLYGARVALLAGVEAVAIAVLLGIPLGLLFGYVGGWVDRLAMRVVEGVMSVPFLVLAISLIGVFGPGLFKSMAVVGVVYAMTIVRLTRGEAMQAREELYVDGVRVAGAGGGRIVFRHILPNIVPPLIVQATLMFAGAIIAEAVLSYLGLGVQSPSASWGGMLQTAQQSIRDNFFLAIPPGLAIFVTVLAINQLGDGLRDLFAREAKGGSLGVNPVDRVEATEISDAIAVDEPMLRVRNLSVSFPRPEGGQTTVVDDVSFDIARGEIFALVGESGSGKSVTAMSILGLVPDPGKVTASSIQLDGEELTLREFEQMRKIRGGEIGTVFQEPIASLNPAYTVGDQIVEMVREHRDVGKQQARKRAVELLDLVGIPSPQKRLRDYPHQFSGGMAQRVMIAMALACDPKLLIADEPTTALDVTVQAQVLDLLLDLREQTGMSILLITHDLGVVADVADRVAVMYAGQVVECGGLDAMFGSPKHPYTEGLLASVPRNVEREGSMPYIRGVVPLPHLWPESCHFADRCSYAQPGCRATSIPLEAERGTGRAVRCVLADDLELVGVGESADESATTVEDMDAVL